jgi:CheY-like chemotaxis protein
MQVKPKILVVDDESVIADSLATILNQSGYEAVAVHSGEQALALATTFSPALMICDVIMGELNGIETAILMRSLLPQIKILLFSGNEASVGMLLDARSNGHDFDFLTKPVHPKDLLTRLQRGRQDTPPRPPSAMNSEMQGDPESENAGELTG